MDHKDKMMSRDNGTLTDSSLRRMSTISGNGTSFGLSGLRERKKFVERGILIVIIFVVIIAIFTPIGILIDEFLNIESGSGSSFSYKESCAISTKEMVSIASWSLYITA